MTDEQKDCASCANNQFPKKFIPIGDSKIYSDDVRREPKRFLCEACGRIWVRE